MVILNNDSNDAKNDDESKDRDIMGNNGWHEYLIIDKLYKIQVYCSAKWPTYNKTITDVRTELLAITLYWHTANENNKLNQNMNKGQNKNPFSPSALFIWNLWTDVTPSGFKAYLGGLLNMESNPKCRIQDYWSQDCINKMLFLKDYIFWTTLLQVLWVLHVSPPALQTQDVKLYMGLTETAVVS
jgi:hypothetical protein